MLLGSLRLARISFSLALVCVVICILLHLNETHALPLKSVIMFCILFMCSLLQWIGFAWAGYILSNFEFYFCNGKLDTSSYPYPQALRVQQWSREGFHGHGGAKPNLTFIKVVIPDTLPMHVVQLLRPVLRGAVPCGQYRFQGENVRRQVWSVLHPSLNICRFDFYTNFYHLFY
jgi:hypothetical protein